VLTTTVAAGVAALRRWMNQQTFSTATAATVAVAALRPCMNPQTLIVEAPSASTDQQV